jgi:RNA polymerase-binding protein DksA
MQVKAKSKRITDLRAFLETERKRLQQEIAHSRVSTDEERAGYSNHMAEEASVVFEQARNVGIQRGEELLLGEVESALRRMEDGSYGVCQRCGQPIDAARLRAMPTAALCITCQEYREGL